jgi:hypothetical protein
LLRRSSRAAQRSEDGSGPRFTNVYVKSLPDNGQDRRADLKALFAEFGTITSVIAAGWPPRPPPPRSKDGQRRRLVGRRRVGLVVGDDADGRQGLRLRQL